MFDALRRIGEAVLQAGGVVEPAPLAGKGRYLVKVIFDLDSGALDCGYMECRSESEDGRLVDNVEVLRRVMWVGNRKGNVAAWSITTNVLQYLLNPQKGKRWAIGSLKKLAEEAGEEELASLLRDVCRRFFGEKGSSEGSTEGSLRDLTEDFLRIMKLDAGDVALYTVAVRRGGREVMLADTPAYRRMVLGDLKVPKRDLVSGVCHACGGRGLVLADPAYPPGSLLKVYNVDKKSFMHGAGKDSLSRAIAHAVCPECSFKLRVGLSYVERYFTVRLLGLKVHLIPSMFGATVQDLEVLRYSVPKAFAVTSRPRGAVDFWGDVKLFNAMKLNCFIHIVFTRSTGKSNVDVVGEICEASLPRLVEVGRLMSETVEEAGLPNVDIGFEAVGRVFPLRCTGGDVDWEPYLRLIEAIISGSRYDAGELARMAVLYARIQRGLAGGYTVKPGGDVYGGLLKYVLLQRFMAKLGCIRMSGAKFGTKLGGFLERQGYEEWQAALFLLGYVAAKADEAFAGSGRPAYGRINMAGMSVEDVKLFAVTVAKDMVYRGVMDRCAEEYAAAKALLDRNLPRLTNPIDNVFYILSGYAYAIGGEGNE